MDARTITILAALYPPFRERVMRVFARMEGEKRMPMRAIEGVRNFARSAQLAAAGKVVAAPKGLSTHNYAAGLDAGFAGADPYLEKLRRDDAFDYRRRWGIFAQVCREEGLKPGFDFPPTKADFDHCELPNLKPHQLYEIYKTGGVKAVWIHFDKLLGLPPGSTWKEHPIFDPEKGGTS